MDLQRWGDLGWDGPEGVHLEDAAGVRRVLLDLEKPAAAIWQDGQIRLVSGGQPRAGRSPNEGIWVGYAGPRPLDSLGSREFCEVYGTRAALYGGAMANAIASEAMVIALGQAGLMGSFGAAGLSLERVEAAVQAVQTQLPQGPYAFNLIFNLHDPAMEMRTAELYAARGVRVVEASAYVDVTAPLVLYRASGLERDAQGQVQARSRLIVKLSRPEVAQRFLVPAPADVVDSLLTAGKITPMQAELLRQAPLADDITVEADSGGHTDNRPLVCVLPAICQLRDEMLAEGKSPWRVRVGAAGGISTPEAAAAALAMGAEYLVTGSVNQACVESGASEHTRRLLAEAGLADVTMAPAADMFEMGVRVQVLKRGTLFPMRAAKLYEVYSRYPFIESIPIGEREKLEKQIFQRTLDSVWEETRQFFAQRDPKELARAEADPHQKMALVFRWYLGLSSRWSNRGEKGREMDYQIWCGPAMGAFNIWTRDSYLQQPENRHVVDVNQHILIGAAYLNRLQALENQGVCFPEAVRRYFPLSPA